MGRPLIDRGGHVYGHLTVLETFRRDKVTKLTLRCVCGAVVERRAGPVVHGETASCGCLRRNYRGEMWRKHGEANDYRTGRKGSPEYRAWRSMINRCERGDAAHRRIYADRGITVCERWRHDFTAFLADIGRRPSPDHSVDRFPNNDGNYEPGNVRWATRSQQAKNRRRRPRINGSFAPGNL